jgi:hypothetical protein
MALFAESPAKAPVAKKHCLRNTLRAKFGSEPEQYFAVESNVAPGPIYATLDIETQPVSEYLEAGEGTPSKPESESRVTVLAGVNGSRRRFQASTAFCCWRVLKERIRTAPMHVAAYIEQLGKAAGRHPYTL